MKEIDSVHKRALRAIHRDYTSTYEVLLQASGFKRIHEIHLSYLLCEIYKTVHSLNPSFMQTLFMSKSVHYSLRKKILLSLPQTKSVRLGTQSFSFRGMLLWNKLADNVKSKTSLVIFKNTLKSLHLSELCSCKICAF